MENNKNNENDEREIKKKIDGKEEEFPRNRENWRRALRCPFKHDEEVTNLCWSPDSTKLASVSMDNSVLIHNTETG